MTQEQIVFEVVESWFSLLQLSALVVLGWGRSQILGSIRRLGQ